MSRRILKFVLTPLITEIETADEPTWLSVAWQRDELVVWCEATVGSGVVSALAAIPTGEQPPDDAAYIGTAQHLTLYGGKPMVMHVYRQVKP